MAQHHLALLRGINVGGKNKLPMADLRGILESLGCEDVRTYIQSGNVVFRASSKARKGLEGRLSESIASTLGLTIPVLIRSAEEVEEAVARNPFQGPKFEPKHLHFGFLADRPTAAARKSLDPNRSPGDRFEVLDRCLYLHCPNGLARTKLTNAYFDRALGTVSTVRNWKTTQKLLEMLTES